jgi:hypothetical protein
VRCRGPCSAHDLRRTFAHWHLAAGMPFDDVARAMGHASTTMLYRVYGHLSAEELRDRMARYAPGVGGPSPYSPRHAAEGAETAVTTDKEKAPFPSGNEAFFGYRRSELNQRPWDYDSQPRTAPEPLFSVGKPRANARHR